MKSGYSRAAPSPRYRRLIEQYQRMHENGDLRLGIPSELTFAGQSLPRQAAHIKRWIERTGSQTILDYGSGKGEQYSLRRTIDPQTQVDHPDIRSYWGVKEIRCSSSSTAPKKTSAGSSTSSSALRASSCSPTSRAFRRANSLPSGGNAHCTVKPLRWWEEKIARAASRKPDLLYEFRLAYRKAEEIKERAITSPE